MESPLLPANDQIIQELPYDIWYQILLRLPAETVIQLKSVCKRWCELINTQDFQISHVDHWRSKTTPQQVIAMSPRRRRPELLVSPELVGDDTIPSKFRCRPIRFDHPSGLAVINADSTILDCYDGLFLVDPGSESELHVSSDHVFLCNPLTNSYLTLPRLPNIGDDGFVGKVVNDPSTRGYVIFCVKIDAVFSLRIDMMNGRKIGNWRQIWSPENLTLMFPDTKIMSFLEESISFNGKAHWLFFMRDDINAGILTIDAATEESIVTKISGTPSRSLSLFVRFFKSNRKFYYLNLKWSESLELWAIDDFHNPTWSKHHVIFTMDRYPVNMSICDFGGIWKQGNRLIISIQYKKEVFIYDLSLKKWQAVDIIDSQNSWDAYTRTYMFINYSLLRWH